MSVYRIEVLPRAGRSTELAGAGLVDLFREAGLDAVERVCAARLFFLEGDLSRDQAEHVARELLADPVTEEARVRGVGDPLDESADVSFEVHPRPGVMDPVAESTYAELIDENIPVAGVRTARRFVVIGGAPPEAVLAAAGRVLANDCIELLVPGTTGVQPGPRPPLTPFEPRSVPLCDLDDAGLQALARRAHLFLSLAEMQAIQAHYVARGREPTDVELETLAQTWSEHCVHKTLRSPIRYRGTPLPVGAAQSSVDAVEERHYDNLLKDTIVRATETLIAEKRGPNCLSVFKDNAGVIAFDDDLAIAFKVETHNHPSAIEPYGGAATGIGGVIRDIIGCGLGAKPIANTDVFCVGPQDWPVDQLPTGVLHPRRVLRGIVGGVSDYGNRMGIPTVNGAVIYDPRYLGNPLVYCGSVGCLPRDLVEKQTRPGDLIVLIGGRTGRDGIHGATFSSAELTDTHADEFSHAVQIGNAITEKRFLDAVLQARDAEGGCLYSAITDCGAGGLSSAVGEMGEHTGAVVDLDTVPLKYAGLRYDEIWISEAQERMVVAVPPDNLGRFNAIMQREEVESTVIGTFGPTPSAHEPGGAGVSLAEPGVRASNKSAETVDPPRYRVGGRASESPAHEPSGAGVSPAEPLLLLRFNGQIVGELDMRFLHRGVPLGERVAEWHAPATPKLPASVPTGAADMLGRLRVELGRPNVASKSWIIRQYDHEVQGGSVIKPLLGPGPGPGDAAVIRPRFDSDCGLAVGCGLAAHLADQDPYWMAAAAIDEALRNVICVGGDPLQTAILDNFCWGRSDDPQQLGALVRACQACHDLARAAGVPFISGKDSLNNEFALGAADVEPLIATLYTLADRGTDSDTLRWRTLLPAVAERIRTTRRLAIPPTLLISAISIVPTVQRCLSSDLKQPGSSVLLVGGYEPVGFDFAATQQTHAAVAELIAQGLVRAAHDVSDGGWLVALAEMALAGQRGVTLAPFDELPANPFDELVAGYLLETPQPGDVQRLLAERGVGGRIVGQVCDDDQFVAGSGSISVRELHSIWEGHTPAQRV